MGQPKQTTAVVETACDDEAYGDMLKWRRIKAYLITVHHIRWADTACRVVRRGRSKAPFEWDLSRWQLWHPTLALQSLLISMPGQEQRLTPRQILFVLD